MARFVLIESLSVSRPKETNLFNFVFMFFLLEVKDKAIKDCKLIKDSI